MRDADITNGHLIWSRATQNDNKKFNYGFTFATFFADKVKVEFFELDADKNILVNSATFNVMKSEVVGAGSESDKDQFLDAKKKVQKPKA